MTTQTELMTAQWVGGVMDITNDINNAGLADYVIQLHFIDGGAIVVLKVPKWDFRRIWKALGRKMENCPIF